jgi:hypothetical protein
MSGWWPWKPKPSAEELAATQTEKNATTLQHLQEQYDDKMLMSTNYGENVKRFDVEASKFRPGSPQRVQLDTQKRTAFSRMQETKKQAEVLWSQIQSLQRVTSNVQSMGTNMDVHARYKESNDVSRQISGKIDVDDVHDTMDAAHEHLKEHDEISEALAGRTMGELVDPDDQDAQMAEFLQDQGAYTEDEVAVAAGTARARQDTTEAEDARRVSAYEEEVMQKLAVLATHKQPAAVSARGGK